VLVFLGLLNPKASSKVEALPPLINPTPAPSTSDVG